MRRGQRCGNSRELRGAARKKADRRAFRGVVASERLADARRGAGDEDVDWR